MKPLDEEGGRFESAAGENTPPKAGARKSSKTRNDGCMPHCSFGLVVVVAVALCVGFQVHTQWFNLHGSHAPPKQGVAEVVRRRSRSSDQAENGAAGMSLAEEVAGLREDNRKLRARLVAIGRGAAPGAAPGELGGAAEADDAPAAAPAPAAGAKDRAPGRSRRGSQRAPAPGAAPPAPPRCGPAFAPADAASREALVAAAWPLERGRGGEASLAAVGTSFKQLDGFQALKLRFSGRGVVRLRVVAASPTAIRFAGALVVGVVPGDGCSMALAYGPDDVLELQPVDRGAGGTQERSFKVEALEVIGQSCEAADPPAEAAEPGRPAPPRAGGRGAAPCSAWQRVRLPWSDCQAGLPGSPAAPRWTDGWVGKVANATHAAIQIDSPPKSEPDANSDPSALFDPASPLTGYMDEGTCGPRGDDAKANTSSCRHGAELVASVSEKGFKIVATVNRCRFFAFEVFRCLPPPDQFGEGLHRVVLPASSLARLPEDSPPRPAQAASAAAEMPRCAAFRDHGWQINIVILGDKRFQKKYESQIRSLQCFVDHHGYRLQILQGNEYRECMDLHDYFFRKHCTVSMWLGDQDPKLVVAVVDADVVAATLDRGLEKWAGHEADVQLYQRCLLPEIMAGNYMVRNTPFARSFLRNWSLYNKEMPIGYSSSDNGAIHLVVQDTVQATNFPKCKKMYKSLKLMSTNDLTQYFAFTKCSLDAIGPPRDWHTRGGVLTVWPRFNFYAADGVYMSKNSGPIGAVLHHGIKDKQDVLGHYYSDLPKCKLNTGKVQRAEGAIGRSADALVPMYPEFFLQGRNCTGTALRQCPARCMRTLSCYPLQDGEEPLVPRTCTDCG